MKFTKTSYGSSKEILATSRFEALGVTVSDTGIAAGADGKKIVPAGTIIGGIGQSALSNDKVSVEEKNTGSILTGASNAAVDAEGVLLHDVDVTHGPSVGTMVIRGEIDLGKIEAPAEEAIEALNSRILFIK